MSESHGHGHEAPEHKEHVAETGHGAEKENEIATALQEMVEELITDAGEATRNVAEQAFMVNEWTEGLENSGRLPFTFLEGIWGGIKNFFHA